MAVTERRTRESFKTNKDPSSKVETGGIIPLNNRAVGEAVNFLQPPDSVSFFSFPLPGPRVPLHLFLFRPVSRGTRAASRSTPQPPALAREVLGTQASPPRSCGSFSSGVSRNAFSIGNLIIPRLVNLLVNNYRSRRIHSSRFAQHPRREGYDYADRRAMYYRQPVIATGNA